MKQQQERKGYGLFSLLSLIVGVVIGSGIFVKNESVVNTAGSTSAALIS
jgi:APA family basic amino acid/polyamine antiporter